MSLRNDEIPQEVLDDWPNCSTPDCGNKACLRLNSGSEAGLGDLPLHFGGNVAAFDGLSVSVEDSSRS